MVIPPSADSPSGYGDYIFLGLPTHDLYLRDNLQDHGLEPLIDGGISCSPDIIVFNQELLDPEAELGTPEAQQNDTLGEKVEYGQDNFIYLRVQNRGTQPTSGTAKIFWADPSVFPTPNSWTEITDPINPTVIPAVNPQEMKIVGPIVWNKGDIPREGHYCFIGLITNGNDPAPIRQ
jgi:serine protease